jgi:hypothetical protein
LPGHLMAFVISCERDSYMRHALQVEAAGGVGHSEV